MKVSPVSRSALTIRSVFAKWTQIALFSMLLTAENVGGAELTLGGIDDTKFKGKKISDHDDGRL